MLVETKEKCCGCSGCVNVCPQKCIELRIDDEGFKYPIIDKERCIACGACEAVCPFLRTNPLRKNVPKTFGAKATDDKIRAQSSSGGVFSLFANYVLEKNGVVYGAALADDCKGVKHIRVTKSCDLARLRGSKYLQSDVTDCFLLVRRDLQEGKLVLFSGVPCQINGLKLLLKKDYENLITTEVICHGVMSPSVWKAYVNSLEGKYGSHIVNVNFREKKRGWADFGLEINAGKIKQFKSHQEDPYLRLFLKDCCLRPSCYNCVPKKLESMADITIGDFWGVASQVPELADNLGTSLVLIQTEKGQKMYDYLLQSHELVSIQVPFENAIKENPQYCKSVLHPSSRDSFFLDFNNYGFTYIQKKYGSISFKEKLKIMVKKTRVKMHEGAFVKTS